jgi:16S rRNA (guanine966-N2)-methyltransferase
MRIIAGEWRGRRLEAPQGEATRPTSDRARETLFSMLVSRIGSFEGLAVLDLFAGTGALGLEALSRGAAEAAFVERDREAVGALKSNIAKLGASGRAAVLIRPAEAPGSALRQYDIAFLDPPYGKGWAAKTLKALVDGNWLAPGALACAETARDETLAPIGYECDAVRDVGKARLHIFRRSADAAADNA